MDVVIGHTTALLYWRAVGEGRLPPPDPQRIAMPDDYVTGIRQLADIDLTPLGVRLTSTGIAALTSTGADDSTIPRGIVIPRDTTQPLDIIATRRGASHRTSGMVTHVASDVATCGVLRVARDIVVVPPAVCYLQACAPSKRLPNVELAMELCGAYSIAPHHPDGMVAHAPLTSIAAMRSALVGMRGTRNVRIALDALAYGANGSRSPKETELYIALTTPVSQGGHGLPKPQVNQRINVVGEAVRFTDDTCYEADLLYPDERVIVEYDGRGPHTQKRAFERDRRRRSVLVAMGYAVIVVTKADLASPRTLEQKVAQIATLIGVDLRVPDEVETLRRSTLHAWLFGQHPHLPFGFGY